MPIDPSISLDGAGAGAGAPAGIGNALSTVGNYANIQNALNQNRLFQQTFQARQKFGQILATAPDLESGLAQAYKDPDVAPFAGEWINSARQGSLTQTQQQGAQQDQALHGFAPLLKAIASSGNNPGMLSGQVQGAMALVPKAMQGVVAGAAGNVLKSLTEGLPDDYTSWTPQQMGEYNKRTAAIATSAGVTPGELENVLGKAQTQDIGGKVAFGTQAPAAQGGGFVKANALAKSLAPQITDLNTAGGGKQPTLVGGDAGGNSLTGAPAPASGAPPNALGLPSPNQTQSEYNTGRTKKMLDYQSDLDDRVNTGAMGRRNVDEILSAAGQAQTGGGADIYAKLGQALQAFGVNNDTVNKVANGNLAASQVIDKASLNNTMNQLKQQLTGVGGSRINQQEFAAYLSKNPNLATDPHALVQVFNLWNDFYNRDKAEQGALTDYLDKGGDIKSWPSKWNSGTFMQQFAPGTPITGEGVKGIGTAKKSLDEIFGPKPGGP